MFETFLYNKDIKML